MVKSGSNIILIDISIFMCDYPYLNTETMMKRFKSNPRVKVSRLTSKARRSLSIDKIL